MQRIESQSQDRTIHLVSLVGSLVLFMSPWVLGYSATTAAVWSAWASGIVIAVISLIALLQLYEWEEWVNGAVGLWAVGAPFVFGFTGDRAATFSHVIVGGAILVLAAYEVFRIHHVGVQTAP
jgi:protein-S-isoprenylcysteine O-methyltransferase Ste14